MACASRVLQLRGCAYRDTPRSGTTPRRGTGPSVPSTRTATPLLERAPLGTWFRFVLYRGSSSQYTPLTHTSSSVSLKSWSRTMSKSQRKSSVASPTAATCAEAITISALRVIFKQAGIELSRLSTTQGSGYDKLASLMGAALEIAATLKRFVEPTTARRISTPRSNVSKSKRRPSTTNHRFWCWLFHSHRWPHAYPIRDSSHCYMVCQCGELWRQETTG